MSLSVEDGSGREDADAYADTEAFKDYCDARGMSYEGKEDEAIEQALRRATTYLDGRYRTRFLGVRTNGRSQALEWPRRIPCSDIENDEIPREIVQATIEAAWRELTTPSSLSPDYVASEQVTSEQVGPLSVTYASGTGAHVVAPVVTVIENLIAPVTSAPGQFLRG